MFSAASDGVPVLSYIYFHLWPLLDELLSRFLLAPSWCSGCERGNHIIQAQFLIAIFLVVNLSELPKFPADCPGQDADKS